MNQAPQPHQAAAAKKDAELVQYSSNKCPECQAQFGSKEEVSDHFQEIKPAHSTVSCVHVRTCTNMHIPLDRKHLPISDFACFYFGFIIMHILCS